MTDEKRNIGLNPLLSLTAPAPAPAPSEADDLESISAVLASLDSNSDLDVGAGPAILDPHARQEEAMLKAAAYDLQSLASMDTDSLVAMRSRGDAVMAQTQKYILRDAESFRSVANALQEAILKDERLDPMELARVTDFVRAIMTTTKQNSELASLLLPEDIKAIVRFGHQTYENSRLLETAKDDNRDAALSRKTSKAKSVATGKKGKLLALTAGLDIKF